MDYIICTCICPAQFEFVLQMNPPEHKLGQKCLNINLQYYTHTRRSTHAWDVSLKIIKKYI